MKGVGVYDIEGFVVRLEVDMCDLFIVTYSSCGGPLGEGTPQFFPFFFLGFVASIFPIG
jgi:hypothetical protein